MFTGLSDSNYLGEAIIPALESVWFGAHWRANKILQNIRLAKIIAVSDFIRFVDSKTEVKKLDFP